MRIIKDYKQYFIGGLAVLAVVAVFFLTQRKEEIKISFDEKGEIIFPERSSRGDDIEWAKTIVSYQEKAAEMFKNDAVGGKTPQETLDLFVEALKAGDTELASRYFVVSRQKQMAEELAVGKENGGIDLFLEYVEKISDDKEIRNGLYRFTVIEENKAIMSFDLVFNEYQGVWKIKSL